MHAGDDMVVKKRCVLVTISTRKTKKLSNYKIPYDRTTHAMPNALPDKRKRTLSNNISLVVVLVAEGRALGVEDIPDADSGAEVVDVDSSVEAQLVALAVSAGDLSDAGVAAVVLPDAEVAVDKSVVQEEDRVGGRGVGVLHDRANTVVAPSVGTTLSAGGHIGVGGTRVAGIDDGGARVGSLGVITVTGETVTLVARAGTDVDGETSELAVRDALATDVHAAEPLGAEDGGLAETASVPSLVEPGEFTVETAIGAEHLLKGPEVVPVPEEELGVTVDVGCQSLVESDDILVSALGLAKLAGCRAALQALDGIDVRLSVGGGVGVPFATDAGAGAGALALLKLLEFLIQLSGVPGEDGRDDVGEKISDDLGRRGVGKDKLRKLVLSILEVLDDGGNGSIYTRQGLVERERASELGSLEVGDRESRRKRGVGWERSALCRSRVLRKRGGRSGDSQNGCGERQMHVD